MPEYLNPGSLNPGYDWKPQGELAGLLYSNDRAQYEKLIALSEMLKREELAKQGMANETYRQDAPVRQAERPSKIAGFDLATMRDRMRTTPEFQGSQMKGLMGIDQQNQAKGAVALGTQESDIAGKIAENKGKVFDYEQKKFNAPLAHIDRFAGLIAQLDPVSAQQAWRQFVGQIPNEYAETRDMLMNIPPQAIPEAIKAIRDGLQNTPEQRGKMDVTREQGASAERQAGITGNLGIARERVQQAGALAVAQEAAKREEQKKLDDKKEYTDLRRKISNKETPASDDEVERYANLVQREVENSPRIKALMNEPVFEEKLREGKMESVRSQAEEMFNRLAINPRVKALNPYKKAAKQYSQEQEQWIQRAMRASTNMSRDEIIAEGVKRGKLPK